MSARASGRQQGEWYGPTPTRLVVLLLASIVLRLLLVAAVVAAEDAPPSPAMDPAMGRLLSDYLGDPKGNRAAILALRDRGVDTLPTPAQLALADAYLRSGSTERAAGILARISESNRPAQWTGWAEYGLGWVALSSGDLSGALAHLERAHAAGWNAPAVATLLGLAEAGQGRGLEAARTLADAAADPSTTTTLTQVAKLGMAYAYYWSGEYAAARNQFALFAREFPDGQLADDASYGAAWSALRAGDRDEALRGLRGLADRDRAARRGTVVSRSQLNLEVRDVLGNGLRRYRRGRYTMQAVDGQIADILDLDGVGLARAALRRVGEPDADVAAPALHATDGELAAVAAGTDRDGKEVTAPRSAVSPNTPSGAAEGDRDDGRPGRLWIHLLILVIAAVALAWLWRRLQSGGGVGALRAGRDASKQGVWRS